MTVAWMGWAVAVVLAACWGLCHSACWGLCHWKFSKRDRKAPPEVPYTADQLVARQHKELLDRIDHCIKRYFTEGEYAVNLANGPTRDFVAKHYAARGFSVSVRTRGEVYGEFLLISW